MGKIGVDATSESESDVEMTTPGPLPATSSTSSLKRKHSERDVAKEPKSVEKSAQKSKMDKAESAPKATPAKGKALASQVRSASIVPPSSQPSVPGETPSKRAKKDKGAKKPMGSAPPASEKKVSAVPLPSFPGRK